MKSKSSTKLSSHVLQMKFMKRTAVQTQEEIALEEQKQQIDDEHWYLDVEEKKADTDNKIFHLPTRSSVIVEPSYVPFEGLVFGRMSFNGFNPQIEKLMKPSEESDPNKPESDEEKEVNDESMANHYQETNLGRTISRKFQSKKIFKPRDFKVKRLGSS